MRPDYLMKTLLTLILIVGLVLPEFAKGVR